MDRLPPDLKGVHTLIVNLDESEAYFEHMMKQVENTTDLARLWMEKRHPAADYPQGSRQCLYASKKASSKLPAPKVDHVVDVTGAGDSFVAGFIYGQAEGWIMNLPSNWP